MMNNIHKESDFNFEFKSVASDLRKRLKHVKKIHIGRIFTYGNVIPIKNQCGQLSKNCHLMYVDKDTSDYDENMYIDVPRLTMEEMRQVALQILKRGRRVSFLTFALTEEEFIQP